jgi:hypothetical protein
MAAVHFLRPETVEFHLGQIYLWSSSPSPVSPRLRLVRQLFQLRGIVRENAVG